MRMKVSRIQTLNHKNKVVTKDSEGVPEVSWGEATQLKGEVWAAGGALQVQTYGDRVNNMMNVRIRGSYSIENEDNHFVYVFGDCRICEGDGLCIYSGADEDPDFKIVRIVPYKPLKLEVEKTWAL